MRIFNVASSETGTITSPSTVPGECSITPTQYSAMTYMGTESKKEWTICMCILTHLAAAAAKSLQSCPTLCDPTDGSPPGSPVPGILQARTLEWIAISFSNAWKWKVKVKSLSHARLSATPWTADYQAPPSMGFSRQEYWSRVPLPSPLTHLTICLKITQHCQSTILQ